MLVERLRPGVLYSPSPLSRMVPGALPPPAAVQAPAVLSQGQVFVPVPGAQGPAGDAARTYLHLQSAPALIWTAPHNLGFEPAVQLRTVGGLVFEADVHHLSSNVTEIRLLIAMAGTARLT